VTSGRARISRGSRALFLQRRDVYLNYVWGAEVTRQLDCTVQAIELHMHASIKVADKDVAFIRRCSAAANVHPK